MIENIVFDMGQVLIRWSPALLMSGMDLEDRDRETLTREVFRGGEWARLDEGTLTEEEALAAIQARLPERLHPFAAALVLDWWKGPLTPMPGMADLVRELKIRGCGIYLLSNASTRLREYFPRIPGSGYFDGLLVSAERKLAKPDPEIYRALFSAFSLDPAACFFIDDSPANVAAARELGMEGYLFREDPEALRAELTGRGIL